MSEFNDEGCLKLNGETCPHGFELWCRACAEALKPEGRLASDVANLQSTLDHITRETESTLRRRFPNEAQRPEAWQMMDQNGRYLLLDAQTALVNGLAAIIHGGGSE